MACSVGMCGSNSRKRQTPLLSKGSRELRRLSHSAFSVAASGASTTQPGKKNSSRSPQFSPRNSRPAESGMAPHVMQRSFAFVSVFFSIDNMADHQTMEERSPPALNYHALSLAQIRVGFVHPIGARWIENVKVDRVFERFCFMRHVRRNRQHFSGIHHDFFAVNPELERSFENECQLLVGMAVLRHNASFFQQHASQHDVLSHNEVQTEQWI